MFFDWFLFWFPYGQRRAHHSRWGVVAEAVCVAADLVAVNGDFFGPFQRHGTLGARRFASRLIEDEAVEDFRLSEDFRVPLFGRMARCRRVGRTPTSSGRCSSAGRGGWRRGRLLFRTVVDLLGRRRYSFAAG